jgi:16S rRNA processing protein RimM
MKVSVAYIKGPRGLKGELAAVLYNPSSRSLRPGLTVTLERGERSGDFDIEFTKQLKKRIGLKLKGIEDGETAENWKGAEVLIEKDKLEPLDESEYYHFELEGAEVYDNNGVLIGIVKIADNHVGNAILYVDTENGEVLIPFVKEIIQTIDIAKKKIVIKRLEGLIQEL